ncbi:Uncharacterized conserved protein YdgA, DUF945 family [Halopseudomonas litoralis]|uniref:Uncharacterized conserved protein YdgA, DUF945 family n=1 Tax=Halopseudomonas litoralis TaxID=797277 RepID=A0A1H1VBB4_9GAMM|nr:YdgA family protein [Halopseudomonas litoralis]SDS82014.1 Uncharacterized conserved protein YdgA, DUF945 family [Halopseudomonas litoralis]
MNKTGIAAVTLGILAVAGTGGGWYTGSQLESVLQDSIRKGNEQLAAQFPNTDVALELVAFERGILSSTARYRLIMQAASGDEPALDLFIGDRIEHGPIPVSRLLSLQWMPVMATSHAVLEPSETMSELFVASAGQSPLTITSNIGYGNGITGDLHVVPMTLSESGSHMTFSGLDADFETDTTGSKVVLSGRFDSLQIDGEDASVSLVGGGFQLDRQRDDSFGLYLGDGHLTLDSLAVEVADKPALVLRDIVQSDTTTLGADGVKGALDYQVGSVNYDGNSLGSVRMDWSLGRLDPQATAALMGMYNTLSMGLEPDDPEALKQQFAAALQQLLKGKPRLALDNFSIRTANGESRFTLGVDLHSPDSFDQPPALLAQQLVGGLDANLVLSKPMLSDMVRYKALFQPEADAAAVEQEAVMAAEMVAGMAEMMQLGILEGDNILSNLRYADGMINLNGQNIELEDFVGLLTMMSPGPALGALE